jgi:carbon monoxide dehydrogenase subunit G
MAQSTTERRRAQDNEHEEIKAMIGELKTLMTARAHIDDKVEKHDKLLNGNGVPGLKTDVQIIKDQLGRLNWASGLVIAGLLADVLSRILSN